MTAFLINPLQAQSLKYPVTKRIDHVDDYFGTKVADPYRWLEDDTAKDVKDWVEAQNRVTFGYLEAIPYRSAIKERMTKLMNYPRYSAPFREGKNYYFFKNDGLQNQSVLYLQPGPESQPEVFLDPNKLSADGTVALSGLAFSRDGKHCAYSISRSGSDWSEIYVMDAGTKKQLADKLLWIKFSGIAWQGDGFYYSRYDAPPDTTQALAAKNEYHKVYYHALGTEQRSDRLVFEDREHPLKLFGVGLTKDERFVILEAAQGGSKGNQLYYRRAEEEKFSPIIETFDDNLTVIDDVDGKLLVQTNRRAPNGRVFLFDPEHPGEENWKDVLPERGEVLSWVSSVGGKLIAAYMKDVADHVFVYDLKGTPENEVALPTLGTVGGFTGKKEDRETFFTFTSFTFPPTIYRYDVQKREVKLFRRPEMAFDPEGYETKQVFYTSKDGTKVPMFIVNKKHLTLDGINPTLLYGYGGFAISVKPAFSAANLAWLETGGVYAVANLRGGLEYGETWHEGGKGLRKQNVFDDFIAAAEYLIAERYTSPAKLAIHGSSNGGLLVGAVINQRPDLFRVALPDVGVMDMLRFHKFTIGWSWVDDYGSSDDASGFKNLYAYSPVHNIREGADYPAVLVTTADHDDRVVPAHSFKYIATLQERYHGRNPVLIRIDTKAGHGGGKPIRKVIEEMADMYAFTFMNMGVTPKY